MIKAEFIGISSSSLMVSWRAAQHIDNLTYQVRPHPAQARLLQKIGSAIMSQNRPVQV